MACLLRFYTAKFDITCERPNPINPIAGESLLLWLQAHATCSLAISNPEAEDWGWVSHVECQGRTYLLGASASDEEAGDEAAADAPREWILQIEKQRSTTEKLFGKAKMLPDDPCVAHLHALLAEQPEFSGLSLELAG